MVFPLRLCARSVCGKIEMTRSPRYTVQCRLHSYRVDKGVKARLSETHSLGFYSNTERIPPSNKSYQQIACGNSQFATRNSQFAICNSPLQHPIRCDDRLRDFAEPLVFVLAPALHPAKRFLLRQTQAAHHNPFRALDLFARLERVAQIVHFLVERLEFFEPRNRERDRGQ